jgi:LuxR family transcriptional regulator, maltose regulon positive regulatory protein
VRGWWRYHHLFADLLRARLRQEHSDRAPQLHHRAATWCAEHGLADDAVQHATAAREMLWAARLIEQHFDETYYGGGEVATIRRWLSGLPAGLVRIRPRLLLAQALLAGMSGPPEAVKLLLDAAERAEAGAADEPFEPTVGVADSMLANVAARIALFRASLAGFSGDAEGMGTFISQALTTVGERERLLNSVSQLHLGVAE